MLSAGLMFFCRFCIINMSLDLLFCTFSGSCHEITSDCRSACSASPGVQKGLRFTYRYSTSISSSMKSVSVFSSQLAFDCVVDIDAMPGCPLMIMRLRNPQIKQSSLTRDNFVLRLKNIREALEKNPLRFLLEGGKVMTLCPREGEQVWALNVKRAILSMLQTSHSGRPKERVMETDLYGSCVTSYERSGETLVKTRHLQQCIQHRLEEFWWQSTLLTEDMTANASLSCVQVQSRTLPEKVNCSETLVLMPSAGPADLPHISTVSSLTLLRTLEEVQVHSGLLEGGEETDLKFVEVEPEPLNPLRGGTRPVQEVVSSVRKLCAHSSDQEEQSELFLNLALQLRMLNFQQLKDVWQEVSFKCRDDWQPLLDALPTCGSESCVHFTTSLILDEKMDVDYVHSLLTTITFTPRPTPAIIEQISALMKIPPLRPKVVLALSSVVRHVCQREQMSCTEIPEVKKFVTFLKNSLGEDCGGHGSTGITELLHVVKATGNIGTVATELALHLNACINNRSTLLELRLAAVQAFRRFPCYSKRAVLARTFQQFGEDVEMRIAAYQQLMDCTDHEVFRIVKTTLSNETSTQVGSFVWSHLVNLQKTEDPLKKDLAESLPRDIISKEFEAEPWKYSSHMDFTMDAGAAIANVEGALVFSPTTFLPRSAAANVTLHVLGRSFNVLEVSVRVENADSFLWSLFEDHQSHHKKPTSRSGSASHGETRTRMSEEKRSNHHQKDAGEKSDCKSDMLRRFSAKLAGQKPKYSDLRCWINVKMFGIDLTFMTCDQLLDRLREVSLNMAGITVKLLKGQEVQVNHRAVVMAEELVLPSLSGLPVKLSVNVSSLYTLRVKGGANFKDWSQFSLAGYIKPWVLTGVWARMAVDGALGRTGLEWVTRLKTSGSLDAGAHIHNGQNLKIVLNTPDDAMDLMSFSSKMYRVNGERREELTTSRNLKEKTSCTPKTWSKLLGWQLCSDSMYPVSAVGKSFPLPGPILFSLRLQKLDRGLQKYLLEAAYAFVPQRNSWMPKEANLLVFLGTPQSTVPRDVSLDFSFSPQKLVLKVVHPLKTILIQGLLEQLSGQYFGRAELLIDDSYHYYLKGLMETLILPSEKRTHYRLEAKVAADGHPVILAFNVSHGLNRKTSLSAKLRNVFSKDASLSVQLERRQDDTQRQYSVDAGLLLPNLLSAKILGLLNHRGPEWNSGLRIQYGLPDSQNMQECRMSQNFRVEVELVEKYSMRAEHEFQCSQISFLNHKVQVQHERSPVHVQSSLDLSYGRNWNQGSNKQRVLLSQSLRNQSGEGVTSYAVEFSLRIPDIGLNFRTQLLHSYLKKRKSESSTHLKINYNDQIPLVTGLHWKDTSAKSLLRKWEGSFNMDTPWLYVYATHKLTQPQHGTTQFVSEITTRKWVTIRNLMLEGLYRERSRDRAGHLHLHMPTITYLKIGAWSLLGKRSVNASCYISTAWTPALRGEISLGNGKQAKTLNMTSSFGIHNLNISAHVYTLDKKLRKKQLMMSTTLSELNVPLLEIEMGGKVEEMRKEKSLYQKRWVLHFRQPLKFLPPSLFLQQTFTINLHKKTYVLESKVLLHDNRKVFHVLTLGYQPQQPYVCSTLIHSFTLENIPQDSELCVSILSNQSIWEVRGTMLSSKMEKLLVVGQIQLHGAVSPLHGITVKLNLTQMLQLEFPSCISLHGDLRGLMNGRELQCIAGGKMTVNDKNHEVYFLLDSSLSGNTSTSISLRSDGETSAMFSVSINKAMRADVRLVNFNFNFRQTLFPVLTEDAQLYLSTNYSPHSFSMRCTSGAEESFQTHLSVALNRNPSFGLSLSAALNTSLWDSSILPQSSRLQGHLNRSEALMEGELTITVDDDVYCVKLRHDHNDIDSSKESDKSERVSICGLVQDQFLCLNITRIVSQHGHSGHLAHSSAHFNHSFPWLHLAGIPYNNSAVVYVDQSECDVSAEIQIQAESQTLKITLENRMHNSTQSAGQYVSKTLLLSGSVGLLLEGNASDSSLLSYEEEKPDWTRALFCQVSCPGSVEPNLLPAPCCTDAPELSLRVEIWLNLTESSQVSLKAQRTLSASAQVQIYHLNSSSGLSANINHNVSSLRSYVPFLCRTKAQLNHSASSVEGSGEFQVEGNMVRFEGRVLRTELGFKQDLEIYNSLPQLTSGPRSVLMKSVYDGNNGAHVLMHNVQWTNRETMKPSKTRQFLQRQSNQKGDAGRQPHGWGLEVRLERENQSRRGNLVMDWALSEKRKRIGASASWSSAIGQTEVMLDLHQPFTSLLSHLYLHTLSHSPPEGRSSNNQVCVLWDGGHPVNITLTLTQQWNSNSSRGQTCVFVSPGQMQPSSRTVTKARACVSVAREGKMSYAQIANLEWNDKKVSQSVKYQIGSDGIHMVKVEAGARNVSPGPCPSHSLMARVDTNLRDVLQHHVLLGVCPPQPAVSWSGSHRVNSGKDIVYSESSVSFLGQAQHSSIILALRNTSSSQRSNYSLHSECKVGNWSVELGGSLQASNRTAGLRIQARFDRSELIWVQASRDKRCFQTAVGYDADVSDDLRTTLCLERPRWMSLEVQRTGRGIENETLAHVSMGTTNKNLVLQARGCEECVHAAEARIQQLGSNLRRKLLERSQKLHHLLLQFRRQAGDSSVLLELTDGPLKLTQRVENYLQHRASAPWTAWTTGTIRHTMTHGLPRILQLTNHMSQLVLMELRKPLATLAGAYHDVTGERLEGTWRQGLELWERELAHALPAVLHHQYLRAPSLTVLHASIDMLDLVSQQIIHWAETKLATMLVGVRMQLASVYKFSERDGEVKMKIPLPCDPRPKGSGVTVAEVLLEDFFLKPLMTLNSASLKAEFYRLKRRLMDSSFTHQALLVANKFAVSFDGRLFKLPMSCDVILVSDHVENAFGVALKSEHSKQCSLVVQLGNTSVTIHPNGQVEINCHTVHTPFANPDVTVWRELNVLMLSNKRGLLVSCDPNLSMCSIILDGWLHGMSKGLLGTNDNEAGNESPLPDGSQASSMAEFAQSWQMDPNCTSTGPETCHKTGTAPSCMSLFADAASPLGSCFRVIDPGQFLEVCERSWCEAVEVSRSSSCRLALAYVQLCHRNYVPLELPMQCA